MGLPAPPRAAGARGVAGQPQARVPDLPRGRAGRASPGPQAPEPLGRPNKRWSLDYIHDMLASGRRFRCLTVVDEYSRECPAIEVAHSLPSARVIEVLEQLHESRGLPEVIVVDNGPEFTGRAFDAWAYARGVKVEYIQPAKPVQNCFVESFNGSFRDECLNLHWFRSLTEARREIDKWRVEYNRVRPHSSLGELTPTEFARIHTARKSSLASPKCLAVR